MVYIKCDYVKFQSAFRMFVFNANQAFFFIITLQFEIGTKTEVFELP